MNDESRSKELPVMTGGRLIESDARRDLRADIIDVAAKLFDKQGYHATTINGIVKEAGCSKGAFYHYFESKEDILYLIHDAFMEHGLAFTEDLLRRPDLDNEKKLVGFLAGAMDNVHYYGQYVGIFLSARRELSQEKLAQVRAKRNRGRRALEQMITEGMACGAFRDDLDPKLIALAILGMGNWMHTWYRPNGRLSRQEIGRQFAAILLDGIRAEARRPQEAQPDDRK